MTKVEKIVPSDQVSLRQFEGVGATLSWILLTIN